MRQKSYYQTAGDYRKLKQQYGLAKKEKDIADYEAGIWTGKEQTAWKEVERLRGLWQGGEGFEVGSSAYEKWDAAKGIRTTKKGKRDLAWTDLQGIQKKVGSKEKELKGMTDEFYLGKESDLVELDPSQKGKGADVYNIYKKWHERGVGPTAKKDFFKNITETGGVDYFKNLGKSEGTVSAFESFDSWRKTEAESFDQWLGRTKADVTYDTETITESFSDWKTRTKPKSFDDWLKDNPAIEKYDEGVDVESFGDWRSRTKPKSFNDWLKEGSVESVTYDADGTPVHKSKDQMMGLYHKDLAEKYKAGLESGDVLKTPYKIPVYLSKEQSKEKYHKELSGKYKTALESGDLTSEIKIPVHKTKEHTMSLYMNEITGKYKKAKSEYDTTYGSLPEGTGAFYSSDITKQLLHGEDGKIDEGVASTLTSYDWAHKTKGLAKYGNKKITFDDGSMVTSADVAKDFYFKSIGLTDLNKEWYDYGGSTWDAGDKLEFKGGRWTRQEHRKGKDVWKGSLLGWGWDPNKEWYKEHDVHDKIMGAADDIIGGIYTGNIGGKDFSLSEIDKDINTITNFKASDAYSAFKESYGIGAGKLGGLKGEETVSKTAYDTAYGEWDIADQAVGTAWGASSTAFTNYSTAKTAWDAMTKPGSEYSKAMTRKEKAGKALPRAFSAMAQASKTRMASYRDLKTMGTGLGAAMGFRSRKAGFGYGGTA